MKYLVLDIGGSAIKYAIMNEKSEIINKDKVVTPRDTLDNFKNAIFGLYDEFKDEIEGIAVSMPGMVDSKTGFAYTGGSLEYIDNINIVELLQEHCKAKITIENDGKCAVKAEHWIGSLKNCNDAAVIVLGTGVGGGIISNGKILKGKHFSAGEFSFIRTDLNKDAEGLSNVWALKNGTAFLIDNLAEKKNIDKKDLDGVKFFEMANNGDADALEVLDEFCSNMAVQIFNLQTILDCEKFAIGGGISAQPILFKYIDRNLKYLYDKFPIKVPQAEVVQTKFLNDANLIGALYTYLYE